EHGHRRSRTLGTDRDARLTAKRLRDRTAQLSLQRPTREHRRGLDHGFRITTTGDRGDAETRQDQRRGTERDLDEHGATPGRDLHIETLRRIPDRYDPKGMSTGRDRPKHETTLTVRPRRKPERRELDPGPNDRTALTVPDEAHDLATDLREHRAPEPGRQHENQRDDNNAPTPPAPPRGTTPVPPRAPDPSTRPATPLSHAPPLRDTTDRTVPEDARHKTPISDRLHSILFAVNNGRERAARTGVTGQMWRHCR